jgi:hypothetical protein
MRKASNTIRKTGADMKRMGKSMSLYMTAPIVALGALSLKAAGDAEEVSSKFDQVFSNIQSKARASANELDKSFGLSSIAAKKLMGDTGDLLTGFGFTQEAALDLSTKVNKLAVDLASFTNIEGGTAKASEALTKALLGESEQAKALGIVIRQNSPEYKNLVAEKMKSLGVSMLQAKALTALEIATKQSRNAWGDYAKTQGSFANQSRELTEDLKDLGITFGKVLIPIAKSFIEKARSVINVFQGMTDRGKRTIVIMAGIAAAIGPVIIIFGTMLTVLPAIGAAFTAMLGPIGLVIAAIAAIAGAFVYVVGNWDAFKERLTNWEWLKNAAIDAFIGIIKVSSFFLNELTKLFGVDFVAPVVKELEKLKGPIPEIETEFKSFGDTIKDITRDAMQAMGFMGKSGTWAFGAMSSGAKASTDNIRGILPQITKMKTRVTDLNTELAKKPDIFTFFTMQLRKAAGDAAKEFKIYKEFVIKSWEQTTDSIQASMVQGIVALGTTLGEALGDMISGVDPNFGEKVVAVIAGFLKQIGTALITYGALMLAFTLLSSNPWTAAAAIVVGIAAIAAATVLTNATKKGPTGAKLAEGGIIPPGFNNDTYPALLSSGERVIPAALPLTAGGLGEDGMHFTGTSRISGKDLLIVFDKAMRDRTAIRGH